jgi:hypothetical protein
VRARACVCGTRYNDSRANIQRQKHAYEMIIIIQHIANELLDKFGETMKKNSRGQNLTSELIEILSFYRQLK